MSDSSLHEADAPTSRVLFGTFAGVFRPTVLTILGAMLYLREGWLVGNNGLLGALLVIVMAYAITGTTALSLSSIATNTRVRAGGAFAIISQAMGLEAGGAIGVPLYIAQTASSAMYIYAFSEAWAYLFPSHYQVIVVVVAFTLVGAVVWVSAQLAFRAQSIMVWVVVAALVSVAMGLGTSDLQPTITWTGNLSDASFPATFAIFFPAATGIMVGVGMSGSLKDPRTAIPQGTLWAWGVSLAVYCLGAVWYALVASEQELLSNKLVMVDQAAVGFLVLLGVLSSTLLAAISNLVAAPRLLQAMAHQRVMPGHQWIGRISSGGEPLFANAVTLLLAGLFLFSGSLDAIAKVITSFFLVTYMAINLVVAVEQALGMISFRPTFDVKPAIPLLGLALCGMALLVTSPGGGLVELGFVAGIWLFLNFRKLQTPWETVRSGVVVTIASWIARKTASLERAERSWQPDLLVPVDDLDEAAHLLPLLHAITERNGSVKFLGLGQSKEQLVLLQRMRQDLIAQGNYATCTGVDTDNFVIGTLVAIDVMQGAFFPPNMVLMDASRRTQSEIQAVVDRCKATRVGLVVFFPHPKGGLGAAERIDVWISERDPDWHLHLHLANVDLPILLGYLLSTSLNATLCIRTVVRLPEHRIAATEFLEGLAKQGRLPKGTLRDVSALSFTDTIEQTTRTDIHLFGMRAAVDLESMHRLHSACGGACVFLLDSGRESLLA